MHNNLKRIISAALAINALSAIAPSTGINFFTKNVQAASNYGITSLKLCKSSGSSTITLYEDSEYDDSLKFKKTKTKYYAKTNSSSVNVRVSEESGYEAKIFKATSSTADAFDPEEKISLKSGTNTLYVRTYKDGEFDKNNVKKNVVNEYKIYVKKSSGSDDDDDDYDEIYLDDLTLTYKDDEIDFDFDEEKTTYNINVKNSVTYVKVCAQPEDDDYTVKINGSTVDEDDDYEKKVTLSEGKNVITVKIKDGKDERVYTLNVTRKTSSGSSTTTQDEWAATGNNNTNSSANSSGTETKKNAWININGRWMYNDALGNPIKNTWFFDRTYNSTYYIDNNGFMVTGWLYKDFNWYYMDNSGAKRTGWQLVAGTWYYLDSNGVMKTGWFKDLNGKWYYLQSNGAMAKNTTINGYKLGSDGAWIK